MMLEQQQKPLSRFALRKKRNKFFIMKSCCYLEYEDHKIQSNYVTILSPINKFAGDNFTCGTPFWNNYN